MPSSRARTKGDSAAGTKKSRTTAQSVPADARRKRRSRPVPRWLTGSSELDGIAQRRCLMILSVLSGERPVTEVIEELSISRGTYYNLEQRALEAMLSALVPGVSAETSGSSAAVPAKRIAELEEKVSRLERDKRRVERALYLTRQVIGRGAVTLGVGRPRKSSAEPRSTRAGRSASSGSAKKATRKPTPAAISPIGSARSSTPGPDGSSVSPSIPSSGGVDER